MSFLCILGLLINATMAGPEPAPNSRVELILDNKHVSCSLQPDINSSANQEIPFQEKCGFYICEKIRLSGKDLTPILYYDNNLQAFAEKIDLVAKDRHIILPIHFTIKDKLKTHYQPNTILPDHLHNFNKVLSHKIQQTYYLGAISKSETLIRRSSIRQCNSSALKRLEGYREAALSQFNEKEKRRNWS